MKRLIVIAAIAVGIGALWYALSRPHAQTLVLTGTVDGNEVVVGSQITGVISQMPVQDGQSVKAGEVIATLNQSVQQAESLAAAAAIQQADANTLQSEAQTQLLSSTLKAKVEQVRAQQAQAQANLAQAQAQLKQAQANWDKAHANYIRTVPLAQKGVASPLDLDNAKADLDAAAAARSAARAGVQAAQRGLGAANAAVQDAQAQQHQVNVQQQQTRALAAAARQAQASREAALARLGFTEVTSPVNGVITLRAAREGEVVNPGSPIATVFQLSDTWIEAAVPETWAPLIKLGETMKVRLPDGQQTQGPVIYKAVAAGFATQRDVSQSKRDIKTVDFRVKVANPQGQLAAGMTAYVLLPIPATPPPLPTSAGNAILPNTP